MSTLRFALALQPPPHSPWPLIVGAALLLILHIGGASLGILSGFAAMFLRKGSRGHRLAGQVFVGAMLTMTAVAAATAPFFHEATTKVMGPFTFYLVMTGWLAARRQPYGARTLNAAAVGVGVATVAYGAGLALQAALSPRGLASGEPLAGPLLVASFATLALGLDAKVILVRSVASGMRIARHVWRMSAALFIATGSALAQPKVTPPAVAGSPLAVLPLVLIVGLMLYWLARTRLAWRAPRLAPLVRPSRALAPAE